MEELTDWWERVNDHREFRVAQPEMEAKGIAFNIGNSCFPRDIVKGNEKPNHRFGESTRRHSISYSVLSKAY